MLLGSRGILTTLSAVSYDTTNTTITPLTPLTPPLDPGAPLQGIEQLSSQVSAQALSSTPTLAILDVADNMRAKIYAMLYRIGFSNLPPVSTKDQVLQ